MNILTSFYCISSILFIFQLPTQFVLFKMIMVNVTTMSGFLLMVFSNNRELQILHAFAFLLLIYLLTFSRKPPPDYRHHNPGPTSPNPNVLLLKHLSLLDLAFISVTVPQSIETHWQVMAILPTVSGACFRFSSSSSLAWAEVAILTVMSYDRLCCHLPPTALRSHYGSQSL